MARLKDMAERVTDLLQVDPRKIQVEEGYNIRVFDAENDHEDNFLKGSIRAVGVRTPLTVRAEGDKLIVVAGHRRLAACMALIEEGVEIMTVPCMPEIRGTSVADRDLDLLTSNGSKQLTPMQKAVPLKRLIGHGWTEQQISERSGLKIKEVNDLLDLLSADSEIMTMVDKGALTPSVAVQTIKSQGAKAVEIIKEAAVEVGKAGRKKVSAAEIKRIVNPELKTDGGIQIHGRKINSKSDFVNTLRQVLQMHDVEEIHNMVKQRLGMNPTEAENDFASEFRVSETADFDYSQEEMIESHA